ncbi:Eco57I restriction-modification methylase domain-containing protein [Longimicrobium terrae]|uniref:site-specific DNA-methyltransferase (adenine-specific) n=1 Tax=Longimicrobium terrae TaxID=1639882 RepID=A0A841GRR8_9BACT|nr:Eco57I restriction-modification methylase domain-containing protein [Longimicrobium terrae]MBB4635936.1 methylase of polypeptide subunit release factors [Longimicrobium terrae]MBB6070332.1 methylase of polypeptide subunit release factors [Longimicrobium terrae]NNC30832.1 N-6 DNA methylase [Longimicrobium terrae]
MVESIPSVWSDTVQQSAEAVAVLGAVFTKPSVVNVILDLAGYRSNSTRLATKRVLEPSCGDGAFLSEVLRRLIESEAQYCPGGAWDSPELMDSIRAVDLDLASLASARRMMQQQLLDAGCPVKRAKVLVENWTEHRDFLIGDWDTRFDFVLGNPPYVRIEDVPRPLLERYRAEFSTLSHRADLYVAFLERGLDLISKQGVLAFICANRFAKNQYGAAIRSLIAERYHVRYYLNLEHTQPFQSDVSAYPAILVVDRERGLSTQAARLANVEEGTLDAIRTELLARTSEGTLTSRFTNWYPDGGPWVTTSLKRHGEWQDISAKHTPLLESAPGTRLGIGVATGADRVFILPQFADAIEASRQVPLAMAADVRNSGVEWSGKILLNPFVGDETADLVDLSEFQGLARYLAEHAMQLKNRHVARARPHVWYRTIDKITVALRTREKLLIPDIQRGGTVGYDPGRLYPHHNLYWVTSETWNLRALQALLRSRLVREQVAGYSVQMMKGALRYQAQTLRKVRIPALATIPDPVFERLSLLGGAADQDEIDDAAVEAFSRSG